MQRPEPMLQWDRPDCSRCLLFRRCHRCINYWPQEPLNNAKFIFMISGLQTNQDGSILPYIIVIIIYIYIYIHQGPQGAQGVFNNSPEKSLFWWVSIVIYIYILSILIYIYICDMHRYALWSWTRPASPMLVRSLQREVEVCWSIGPDVTLRHGG